MSRHVFSSGPIVFATTGPLGSYGASSLIGFSNDVVPDPEFIKELLNGEHWRAEAQGDSCAAKQSCSEEDIRAAITSANAALQAKAQRAFEDAQRAAEEERARKDASLERDIVVGEIVAYRAWMLRDGLLASVAVDTIWRPGETMQSVNPPSAYLNYEGIYAFKDLGTLRSEFSEHSYVLGCVDLWGEVIETEHGYRAEFARVHSIISMPKYETTMLGGELKALRTKYGVA
jgi:hypothetical protein